MDIKRNAAGGAIPETDMEVGGNRPPTPPIIITDEKDDLPPSSFKGGARARGREEASTPPTLEEALAYAAEAQFSFDVEEFWDYYEVSRWTVRGVPVGNWKALMRNWARRQARWRRAEQKRERKEAVDLARLEARVDAREAKREKRMGGRRKADNNVEMSDKVREEVRRDFDI